MERRLSDEDDGGSPEAPASGDAAPPAEGEERAAGGAGPRPGAGFARGRTPRCPQCRYDLTGTLEAGQVRCPECGHALDPGEMQVTRERRFFNRMGLLVVALSVVGILGTTAVLVLAPEKALFVVPLFVFGAAWIPFLLLARGTRDMIE